MEHLVILNRLLCQPEAILRHKSAILSALEAFTDYYSEPSKKLSSDPDDMRSLFGVIRNVAPHDIELLSARSIKILLRKSSNRTSVGKFGMNCIVKALMRQSERLTPPAAELGNVVLNACYACENDNIGIFLDEGGLVPLLSLLRSRDVKVQGSALGALQGICYVQPGRQALRQIPDAIAKISSFLESDDDIVRARAAGTIHNISADSLSIYSVREANCLSSLITLLRDHSPDVCHAAAGTIQNMSREVSSKETILSAGAVSYLADLLCGDNVDCQVAAVGALLNLLSGDSRESNDALRTLLTDGVALGAIRNSVFEITSPTSSTL